jgi:hypothetical protein
MKIPALSLQKAERQGQGTLGVKMKRKGMGQPPRELGFDRGSYFLPYVLASGMHAHTDIYPNDTSDIGWELKWSLV